ncbi:MAG: hypothetical protein R3F60_00775 [bacterium]
MPVLAGLAREAGAAGVVAACTELHPVALAWPAGDLDLLDPLDCVVDRLQARWDAAP